MTGSVRRPHSKGVSKSMFGAPFNTSAQASTPVEISTASTAATSGATAWANNPGPHP